MRTAVASLSPLVDEIRADIGLPAIALGVIGTLPPVCYAVFGILAPGLARRFGIERMTVVAMAALVLGLVSRGLVPDAMLLVFASALTFAALGVGNVLLPPLVKLYFPDRIALITTMYATAMAVSTFIPPLLAVPVADAFDWRISLLTWGVFASVALIPWIVLLSHPRGGAAQPSSAVTATAMRSLVRSPIAWSLTVLFITTGFMAYTSFAWLPSILRDLAGVNSHEAGALLALFAFIGLPASLIVPTIASRPGGVWWVIGITVPGGIIGALGLLIAPTVLTGLWVLLLSLPSTLFTLTLTLINLRSRTAETSAALSGFVQSIGYAVVALGPLSFAVLFEVTGEWRAPIIVMIVVIASALFAGAVAARPRFVDDEIRAARVS